MNQACSGVFNSSLLYETRLSTNKEVLPFQTYSRRRNKQKQKKPLVSKVKWPNFYTGDGSSVWDELVQRSLLRLVVITVYVVTKTWNHPKPLKTSQNHRQPPTKPAKTTQNHPQYTSIRPFNFVWYLRRWPSVMLRDYPFDNHAWNFLSLIVFYFA